MDFFRKIIHDACGIDIILAMTDGGGLRAKEFILRGFFADVFERDGFGCDHGCEGQIVNANGGRSKESIK